MEVQILENQLVFPFFMIFLAIYFFGYFIIFENWQPEDRRQASSCLTSLAHGTPVVLMSIYAIQSSPSRDFASRNTFLQDSVLEFSIAYFILDLLHYLLFFPSDVVFIVHHLGALYVMFTCRYVVNHGAAAILVILVLAEVTSPVQNLWSLFSLQKKEVPEAAKLYETLSAPFLGMYLVVRGIVAPSYVHKMVMFYQSGAADLFIPRWAWCSWMVVTVIGVAASIPWVLNHWKEWHRERSQKKQA